MNTDNDEEESDTDQNVNVENDVLEHIENGHFSTGSESNSDVEIDGEIVRVATPSDDVMNENNAEDDSADQFDIVLPTWHRYLGRLTIVPSANPYTNREIITILGLQTNTLVFPGFTLPLVLRDDLEITTFQRRTAKNNTFVLLTPEKDKYGVLMEMCESHARNDALYLKAKCRQRCHLVGAGGGAASSLKHLTGDLYEATISVLEEPPLRSPLLSSTQMLSLLHHQIINGAAATAPTTVRRLRRQHASQYTLPAWLYEQYEYSRLAHQLHAHLIHYFPPDLVPAPDEDPIHLSYWFAQNYLLKHGERLRLLTANSTVERLQWAVQLVDGGGMRRRICCTRCHVPLARQCDIFAMSRDGVQTNYCNPEGHVFEIVTVRHVTNVSPLGMARSEFSWFPGYAWTIIQCAVCAAHLGWRFTSSHLKPVCFFGLAKSGFDVELMEEERGMGEGN